MSRKDSLLRPAGGENQKYMILSNTRLRSDSILCTSECSPKRKENCQESEPKQQFSALHQADSEDTDSELSNLANNPFTKNLMKRLGPEFNPANLINKNKKMFHNLTMLKGFALCAEDEEYEHTYLDQIKIEKEVYDDKPVYIDKLFEKED